MQLGGAGLQVAITIHGFEYAGVQRTTQSLEAALTSFSHDAWIDVAITVVEIQTGNCLLSCVLRGCLELGEWKGLVENFHRIAAKEPVSQEAQLIYFTEPNLELEYRTANEAGSLLEIKFILRDHGDYVVTLSRDQLRAAAEDGDRELKALILSHSTSE